MALLNRPDTSVVVVATGADEQGVPSVALWWAGLSGEPRAGWLFAEEVAYQDPVIARRLLTAAAYARVVHRRSGDTGTLLRRLALCAGEPWQSGARPEPLDVEDLVAAMRRWTGPGVVPDVVPAGRCEVVDELLAVCYIIGWATRVRQQGGPDEVTKWLRSPANIGMPS